MFIDFKKYVDFLSDKKITPNQLALLWMIFYKDWASLRKYSKEVSKIDQKDLNYLIDKGYILYTGRKGDDKFYPDGAVVTQLFSDELIIENSYEAVTNTFAEILEVYPKYFIIGGKKQVTTSCNLEQLAERYFKIIKGDRIQHKSIVEKTKIVAEMMRKGELNNMKIDKYVDGWNWKAADLEDENRDIRRSL